MTHMISDELLQKQLNLELKYHTESVAKAQVEIISAMENGTFETTSIGQKLLQLAIPSTVDALKVILGRNINRATKVTYALLKQLEPELVAVVTLRTILSVLMNPKPPLFAQLARDIGTALETELLVRQVEAIAPNYDFFLERDLQKTNTTDMRRIRLKYMAASDNIGHTWDTWDGLLRNQVGTIALNAALESGLFEMGLHPSGHESPMFTLEPTPAVTAHVLDVLETLSGGHMKLPYMVIPPKPWTGFWDGGYLTSALQVKSPMMRLRSSLPKDHAMWVQNHLKTSGASEVRTAMTMTQNVGYKVNVRVLDIFAKALANARGILGLPRHGVSPPPLFPFPEGWEKKNATPEDLTTLTNWKNVMSLYYTQELRDKSKKLSCLAHLQSLRIMSEEERVYFPTFIDSRGRMYLRGINPTIHDTVKGCLMFAEGKKLGERGLFWLKVHIANCAGYDKPTFELRAQWVDDNIQALTNFAEDPFNIEAPEPSTAFPLLAALYDYFEAMSRPDPREHISHIPVAMDATCSGLQHFSAMFRDLEGGSHTNLMQAKASVKADIYQTVADKAVKYIPKYAKDPVILDYWKDFTIPRSMAKRPVMTYVYGAQLMSTINYIQQDMFDANMPEIPLYSCAKLATPIGQSIRQAVAETVPSAALGMKYLQSLVRAQTDPLTWITPVGVPVVNWGSIQEEPIIVIRSVRTRQRIRTRVAYRKKEYNRREAATGMSPNFIHSLDSAHLCKTILASPTLQILPIHDSFATHPCDVDALLTNLKREFYEMYKSPVSLVDSLLAAAISKAKENPAFVEEAPPMGQLKIEGVLNSTFMFC